MGIVTGPSIGKDRTRPIVQLLDIDEKQIYQKGSIVDLSEKHPQKGTHLRNIIESMHPSDLGIQAAEYLL
jgi:hypothetical protein